MKGKIIKEYYENDIMYNVGDLVNIVEFKNFECYGILEDDDFNIIGWIPKKNIKVE